MDQEITPDYFAEVTWQKMSLIEQWENRDETRIRWERNCLREFGFIPAGVLMHKTSWLLGAVLETVRGGVASGIFFIGDLPIIRSAKVEPFTVIFTHPLASADIVVYGDRLMKWPI